jgi:hypothetical protein
MTSPKYLNDHLGDGYEVNLEKSIKIQLRRQTETAAPAETAHKKHPSIPPEMPERRTEHTLQPGKRNDKPPEDR